MPDITNWTSGVVTRAVRGSRTRRSVLFSRSHHLDFVTSRAKLAPLPTVSARAVWRAGKLDDFMIEDNYSYDVFYDLLAVSLQSN